MYDIITFRYFAEFVRSTDFSEISFCALLAPFFDFFSVFKTIRVSDAYRLGGM